MSRRGALLLTAALTLVARDARAWDSICYEWPDPTKPVAQLGAPTWRGCEGVLATRGRWRDPLHWLDEHRVLLRHAMRTAGLPAALLETVVLAVPTRGNRVDAGDAIMVAQQWPLAFDAGALIAKLERRGFALDELAQLPDFSYSLGDWAGGNEDCPVAGLRGEAPSLSDPVACHRFKTHMGALNATHFPPQSDRWYRWMHDLARTRADQCKAMRAGAWASFGDATLAAAFDGRWTPIWRECEVEALALEAVAQHYLQDSWSSGHMWQRWGSSDLLDFPALDSTTPGAEGDQWRSFSANGHRLMVGELIGLFAGTIHGSDGPQFEASLTSIWPKISADAVCYPSDESIGYLGGAGTVPAAGDMHLHDVLGDPLASQLFGPTAATLHDHYDSPVTLAAHTSSAALAPQLAAVTACASGSVREIYDHLADPATFGAATFGAATGAAPPPPGAACAAPRLSAVALAAGIEDPLHARLKYRIAKSNGAILSAVPDDVDGRVFHAYDATRSMVQLLARVQPTSAAAADLAWPAFAYDEDICTEASVDGICVTWSREHRDVPAGQLDFLDVHPNASYAPAAGARPSELADPPLPWGDPAMPQALVDNSVEQVLASTFNRAHAPLWCARTDAAELTAFENRARTAPQANKAEACRVCTEVVARHVRPGVGGKSLCEVLQPGSVVLAGDGEPERVAEARCGCADTFAAIADNGLSFVRTSATGAVTVVGGPTPTGALTRDAVAASRDRIFVTNGAGDIVGLRWAGITNPAAVELDLTPTDPATTRYHVGGDPRGLAFVESLGKDWLLVVDNATDLLRVYDLGDANLEKFELCSTVDVGRDPARVEGAWDLVVRADGSRAFVSIRGGVATPGDAIAMIDLLGLFTCDGQNPPVTHVTTFGGGQGLGAMAFSPDQQYLAVAARLRNQCPDQAWTTPQGTATVAMSVGCDLVYVLRVSELAPGPLSATAPLTFGARTSFPTRPVAYPYAVAWRPDGGTLAYGSFLGPSPWPVYASGDMGAQGAIALGTINVPVFPAPGGPLHWSYNAGLGGTIAGETVEFTADGAYLLAAALDGKVYSFPGGPTHDFWQNREADPETLLHAGAILRSWYGGCRRPSMGACTGAFCPLNCPTGATDAVQTVSLGSPIRKLLRL